VVGVPVRRHRGDRLGSYARSYAQFFLRASWLLARHPRRFDAVHVHSLPEAMVFAALVPKLAGRPVVLDVHDLSTEVVASRRGEVPWFVRWLERRALRFADRVITVHDDYLERIVARGVARDRVTVVLNLPDTRLFPRRRPIAPRVPPRLIYHGTLVHRYGLTAAMEAVARVRHEIPGVSLDIIGEGDGRPEIAAMIAEHELSDAVRLSPGSLALDEIAGRIRAADVGIVPFLDDRFTRAILPTKLLEYVVMGLPTICSRNPVIERYFSDEAVWLVDPGDVDQLAEAIRSVAADPARARDRARSAQTFFACHDWCAVSQRFVRLFEELIGQ
jgi:glycosyltransferase involved in cell wall biosynthesis